MDAFNKLKSALTRQGCKVRSEQPPAELVVVQGSLWGTTPKTCQKTLTYHLTQKEQTTEITSFATLTSSYRYFTIAGCTFSVVLLVLCSWIAIDLSSSAPSVWGWLATSHGQFRADVAQVFTQVTSVCTAILGLSLGLETVILLRVHRGIHTFADSLLTELA